MEIMDPIKDIRLSQSTVTCKCKGMAVKEQLKKDIDTCECFSLQFNESTDMMDRAMLCVFIVFGDMNIKEELLTMLQLKDIFTCSWNLLLRVGYLSVS